MRAAVLRGKTLTTIDIAEPTLGEGQVLVRTLACGICGSDLHAHHHLEDIVSLSQQSGAADNIDPASDLVMGHEFCCEVLEHGPGTSKRFKAGTHVVSTPYAFGPGGPELIGFSTRFNGAFAERLVLTEALMLEVPNGLAPDMASLVEPLSVGTHAVAQANVGPASVCLVVGCGPVGLAVIVALKRRGIGPVIACDYSPARRALAERLGADIVIDPASASPHAHWEAFDVPATLATLATASLMGRTIRDAVIFECVGVPGLLPSLIQNAPPTAHIVVVGACMEEDRFVPVIAINKQLRLSFVFAYSPDEFAETLHALAEGEIDAAPFLTGRVGINDVADMFAQLGAPAHHVKVVVEPWRA